MQATTMMSCMHAPLQLDSVGPARCAMHRLSWIPSVLRAALPALCTASVGSRRPCALHCRRYAPHQLDSVGPARCTAGAMHRLSWIPSALRAALVGATPSDPV